MIDAAIVMIENAHKHLNVCRGDHTASPPMQCWPPAKEVGPALFFSLLIITVRSCRSSRWKSRKADVRRWPHQDLSMAGRVCR